MQAARDAFDLYVNGCDGDRPNYEGLVAALAAAGYVIVPIEVLQDTEEARPEANGG